MAGRSAGASSGIGEAAGKANAASGRLDTLANTEDWRRMTEPGILIRPTNPERSAKAVSMKTFSALFCLLAAAASPALGRPETAASAGPLHWAHFPVRVFLPAHGPGQTEEAQVALAGFDEWTAASHGKIRYVRVADAAKAEITVMLVPGRFLSADVKSVGAVGETTVYSSGGVLQKASIRLVEGLGASEDVQATAAHEFGHALGISGHSDDPGDLMYPVETLHLGAPEEPAPGAAHTVTAHDLRLLAACYPVLFSGDDRKP